MNTMNGLPSQPMKRKSENENMPTVKRINTNNYLPPSPSEEEVDQEMNDIDTQLIQDTPNRPTTPPLGMTLSHYNASTGTYTSSQLNSNHEVKSPICTGMTPVYRAPFERWGSCLI